MSSRLQYGAYEFGDSEGWLQIIRQSIYGPRGRRTHIRNTWIWHGVKINNDSSDLTAELEAMETAVGTDGLDLSFAVNGEPSAHYLNSADTLNGIQVMNLSYNSGNAPWGSGTEYAGKRSYSITFVGDVAASESNLISYYASYRRIGTGGSKTIWQDSLTGLPQMQQVKAYTTYTMIQSGQSIGFSSAEPADTPLYLSPYLDSESVMIDIGSPLRVGRVLSTHYPTKWRYVFRSAGYL